jgi:nickel-dependent lactate racemase
MEVHLPFGHSHLSFYLPDYLHVDLLEAPVVEAASQPAREVSSALQNLLGEVSWSGFKEARSVAIAINDKTRPVPHGDLLPPLLNQLAGLGIPDHAITFFIAVGTHQPMSPDEFPAILPAEISKRYRVVSHDASAQEKLIRLGETSRGTPVWANRAYVRSDLKIVVGNIEPHQFAGFSGGVKTAAIGLSGFETINKNHALMIDPDSQMGKYKGNPARQDIEEIGGLIGIDLALNAVLNQQRQIVLVLAGDPYAVMETGIPLSRQVCQIAASCLYGLVIASPGGHPKDINVYQSQKGLAHAAQLIKPGGTILLAAACPEGSGSQHYQDWMVGKRSYVEVLEQFMDEGFRVGPHKAYLIARDAMKLKFMFYSEMDESLSRDLLLNPVHDFQEAVDSALQSLDHRERVGIMPHAASTIPYIQR